MFGRNKRKQEIEVILENIRKEKEELIKILDEVKKEKQQFLKMQELMYCSITDEVVDISNVYVWFCDGIYSLVSLDIQNFIGETIFQKNVQGFRSTVTDIFTGKVIYTKSSVDPIEKKEVIRKRNEFLEAYVIPVYKKNKKLLLYADKKVPKYVLQKYYYELNNINLIESDASKKLIK